MVELRKIRKIRMIKDLSWPEGYIPLGLESICIYPGLKDESLPTRVFFPRNGVLGCRGVVGLPIGAIPIFDLYKLEGYYEVLEHD